MKIFYNENFWKKVKIVFLAMISVIAICLVIFCPVHAEELSDTTIDENNGVDTSFDGSIEDLEPILSAYNLSSIDLNSLEDDEKLTAIETHLNELGYAIEEINGVLEIVQTSELEEEEERLAISEKLDILILGINEVCEFNLSYGEYLENLDLFMQETNADNVEFFTAFQESLDGIKEDTVSGNALISVLGDELKVDMENISQTSIEEFNKTLIKTNTLLSYMFWLLLFVLVFIICFFIGQILKKIFGNVS